MKTYLDVIDQYSLSTMPAVFPNFAGSFASGVRPCLAPGRSRGLDERTGNTLMPGATNLLADDFL